MSAVPTSPAQTVRAAAEELGFVAAWSPGGLPDGVVARYREWLAAGRHALMGDVLRGVDVRLDVAQRFGWVRSALVLAMPHAYPDPGMPHDDGVRVGRVGRVFWVREQSYVERIARPAIEEVKLAFRDVGFRARDWVDQGPLPVRSYAAQSGLGWIGLNGMLIAPELGSYATLAVLLTDMEVEAPAPHVDRCGSCRRCLPACPTGALLGDGTLNAWRCTSYWTTQHPGLVPTPAWAGIGEWVFGCDICQQACPWNAKAEQVWRRYAAEPDLAHPDVRMFFSAHDDGRAFERTFASSAFERAGRTRMARNAVIVVANSGDVAHLPTIRLAARDVNPVVRATAVHALVRLGDPDGAMRLLHDPDESVVREAQAALVAAAPQDRSFDQ